MNKSEDIKELVSALAKFQAEVRNPNNTADNPFFKSKYAPLHDILNIIRPLLSKNGLSIMQAPSGDGENIIITTVLAHSSGQWIEFDPLILRTDKPTAQGAGSAITYGRRYALSAIVGISSEDDDDGNGAEPKAPKNDNKKDKPAPPQKKQENNPGLISKEQAKRMYAIAKGNVELIKGVMKEFGYEKSEEVKRSDYDKICTRIEEQINN